MKLCLISDTHGFVPDLPKCDVVLHAGDFSPVYDHDRTFQRSWYQTNFVRWVMECDCRHFVYTFGNHELFPEDNDRRFLDYSSLKIETSKRICLQNAQCEINGLKIWGFSYQLPFGWGWNFNRTEKQLEEIYSKVDAADIIISHGPPYGCGDKAPRYNAKDGEAFEHAGSKALLNLIDRVKPKLVVTGHIHGSYGTYKHNKTTIMNASVVNERYQLVNCPLEIEL